MNVASYVHADLARAVARRPSTFSANLLLMAHEADSLDTLLSMPVDQVLQDLIALREARKALENRETLLQRTLELLVEAKPDVAAYLERPDVPSTPFGPLRMQIKRVLGTYPFRDAATWLPREVLAVLQEQGARDVSIDNVRVTMRRMAKSGELREFPGLWFAYPYGPGLEQTELDTTNGEQPAAVPVDQGAQTVGEQK